VDKGGIRMKKEIIHQDTYITVYLINDRFVVATIFPNKSNGGDVKILDLHTSLDERKEND
jgi:hypothetical protein